MSKRSDNINSKTVLGYAPFIAEPYFGHRSRIYQLDLYSQVDKIAEIITEAYNQGVRAINLVNDDKLLKAFDIADCNMEVIATIGKSDIDYMNPNYEIAKEADWVGDIELFSSYNCPIMLVDEFIVDSFDWGLTSEILTNINENASSGIVTAFPCKTTDLILNNLDLNLFDYYMIPINRLAYMMDIPAFRAEQREKFRQKIMSLNKKIIASRPLAAGIHAPNDACEFFKTLDYVDLIAIGVASKKEAVEDFNLDW